MTLAHNDDARRRSFVLATTIANNLPQDDNAYVTSSPSPYIFVLQFAFKQAVIR